MRNADRGIDRVHRIFGGRRNSRQDRTAEDSCRFLPCEYAAPYPVCRYHLVSADFGRRVGGEDAKEHSRCL